MLLLISSSHRFTGPLSISGDTKVQSFANVQTVAPFTPVFLFEKASGILVAKTVSDANGAYAFHFLSGDYAYFAVAFDPTGTYDATATQNLQVTA